MRTIDIVWCCIIGAFVCGVLGFWIGYQRGELQGSKYIIHELMRNGSVTMVHTDGNTKMIWEVNIPNEKIISETKE